MKLITFYIDESLDEDLEKMTSNKSGFIRDAIRTKLGKQELSLIDIEKELQEIGEQYFSIQQKYDQKLNELLANKSQLKMQEIEDFEAKKQKQEQETNDFILKWTPILSSIPEIKNFVFVENWDRVSNLSPLIDKIRTSGLEGTNRFSISDARKYLTLQHQISVQQTSPEDPHELENNLVSPIHQ